MRPRDEGGINVFDSYKAPLIFQNLRATTEETAAFAVTAPRLFVTDRNYATRVARRAHRFRGVTSLNLKSNSVRSYGAGTPAHSEDTLPVAEFTGVRPMIENYPLERADEATPG